MKPLELDSLADDCRLYTASDVPGIYTVLTQFPIGEVPAGSIYRINTGAPLPDAFDSVIMVEDTELVANNSDIAGEEMSVKLLAQVEKGENIRNPGSDVKKGDKVLERGDVISAVGGELGTLAFVGRRSVSFFWLVLYKVKRLS